MGKSRQSPSSHTSSSDYIEREKDDSGVPLSEFGNAEVVSDDNKWDESSTESKIVSLSEYANNNIDFDSEQISREQFMDWIDSEIQSSNDMEILRETLTSCDGISDSELGAKMDDSQHGSYTLELSEETDRKVFHHEFSHATIHSYGYETPKLDNNHSAGDVSRNFDSFVDENGFVQWEFGNSLSGFGEPNDYMFHRESGAVGYNDWKDEIHSQYGLPQDGGEMSESPSEGEHTFENFPGFVANPKSDEEKMHNLVSAANKSWYRQARQIESDPSERSRRVIVGYDGYASSNPHETVARASEVMQSTSEMGVNAADDMARYHPELVAAHVEIFEPSQEVKDRLRKNEVVKELNIEI